MGETLEIEIGHPKELESRTWEHRANVGTLIVRETSVNELPERDGREVDLSRMLLSFPVLTSLTLRLHGFVTRLSHPTIETVHLEGAVTLAQLEFPKVTTLILSASGDVHGCAIAFENFEWLLSADLPRLETLDLRGLDTEITQKKSHSFIRRWAEASLTKQLKNLGLDGIEMSMPQLKKHFGAFEHLNCFVVSGLRSATDKNPIGGNLHFESEFPDVALLDVPAAIAEIPQLDQLTPKLSEEAYCILRDAILAAPFRYDERVLAKSVTLFCKKRQWDRANELLALSKQKAANRRVHMNVREKVEVSLRKILEKKEDPKGQALLEKLEAQNKL